MQVAIAGSGGFVGRHVLRHLEEMGVVCKVLRRCDLDENRIVPALSGIDAIVNCAGEKSGRGEAAVEANVALPRDLYRAARKAGLKHMIHVSSVAAISSTTPEGVTLGDDAPVVPTNPYGASKLAGDRAVLDVASDELALTILRPPILIGPDAGGVFALLRRAARAGVPLPFAGLSNRRSFMHVDNFAEAVRTAILSGCRGIFITTDSHPITPEQLYRRMTECAGHSPRLFSVTRPGRAILQRALGAHGASLFDNAAFDGGRFIAATTVQWPIPEGAIIAAAMKPEPGF